MKNLLSIVASLGFAIFVYVPSSHADFFVSARFENLHYFTSYDALTMIEALLNFNNLVKGSSLLFGDVIFFSLGRSFHAMVYLGTSNRWHQFFAMSRQNLKTCRLNW